MPLDTGGGGMRRLRLWPGGGQEGGQSCSGPSGGKWPEYEDPLGGAGRQEKLSSRWQESHRPPGTSLCDAGPLAAGPHCWAWAEREKELEKQVHWEQDG